MYCLSIGHYVIVGNHTKKLIALHVMSKTCNKCRLGITPKHHIPVVFVENVGLSVRQSRGNWGATLILFIIV